MDCKQIGQYVLLCNDSDWYFDNDNNGMSYFIYKPTDTKYSMVMAPQHCCCGCNNEPNIEFGTNAQVIQTTMDANEAQEWLNSLVNNNFMGMVAVPTYIKQYESIRKYFNAINSSKFTESDLHYLEENMYKAYNITEQSFINYVNYYSEHCDYNPEFANVDRFVEGFRDTVAKFLAGKSGKTGFASTGLLAMLPMIISKIPGLGQYATLLRGALCIAKVWAGIKMAQASPKYLSSDKKGRVLMIAGAIASQVLQCFAVLRGRRFLTGIVNKLSMVVANLAYKNEPATVLAATTATAATTAAIADAGVTDTSVIEELHNPEVSMDEKVELLKDADVPEEQITKITKAVETETAAKTALKSEATEAVNKANQEQMAAAAAEKQQPAQVTDNNVKSVEQTPTEVASSQPVKTANNEQVAVNDQIQEQPAENTNAEQVAAVNNQQTQTVATIQPQQPVENKPVYDTGTGTFLSKDTTLLAYQNRDAIQDYKQAEKEWNAGTEEIYSYRHGSITNADLKWEELSNEEQAKVMKQVANKDYNANNVNTVEKIFDQANRDKKIFDQKQAEAAAAEQARIDAENARLEAERQAKLEAIRAENERVQLERQTQQNAEKQDAINTLKAQSAGYELAKSQLPRSDRQGRKEINQLIRGNKKAIKQLS